MKSVVSEIAKFTQEISAVKIEWFRGKDEVRLDSLPEIHVSSRQCRWYSW